MKSVVLPAIKKTGVETGTTAYLTINGSDTTAAQSQLDSFIERWKSEGVNALFVTGEDTVTKQFVEKVTKQMPGIMLLTDIGDALAQGQDETKAGLNPNPYQGMYIAGGFAAADYAKSANWKYCKTIYEAADGQGRAEPDRRPHDHRRRQVVHRRDVQHHQRRVPDGLARSARSSRRSAST